MLRSQRRTHYIVSTIVIALTAWSLVILYRIFILGAWPTFLPHIVIGLSAAIAAFQFVIPEIEVMIQNVPLSGIALSPAGGRVVVQSSS